MLKYVILVSTCRCNLLLGCSEGIVNGLFNFAFSNSWIDQRGTCTVTNNIKDVQKFIK